MKKPIRYMVGALCSTAILFHAELSAAAEVELPEGAVQGLPEQLMVVDEDGTAVNSDTGAYFFQVEDMTPGESYSKTIQLMNLREDASYHIYLYIKPLDAAGEIDLAEECNAVMTLDGTEIYTGKVGGADSLEEEPLDLGAYAPGESRTMLCTITWNGTEAGGFVDNGQRIVSKDGTEVVQEASGQDSIYGEVTFQWLFYAVVDTDYDPPKTGLVSENNRLWMGLLAGLGVLVLVLGIVVYRRGKEVRHE